MRKVKLYIATSIDGKIAKEDGDTGWLHDLPNPDNSDYGYGEFYSSVDTTLMGNSTYKMIQSFDVPFPYSDKVNYVFTHDESLEDNDDISYVNDDPIEFIKKIKEQPGEDIWLVGGGQMNTLLMENDLIDELILFIMPIILGPGIPLFPGNLQTKVMDLVSSKTHASGALELIYQKQQG